MRFPLPPRSLYLAILVSSGLATATEAQVAYALDFDTEAQTWQVEAQFANPGEDTVDFWIPRWTPGAYHISDYGRFVKELRATDGDGKDLKVTRVSDSQFSIAAKDVADIVVSYTADSISDGVFTKNIIDVESNRVRADYAYVTPVSLFGFVPELMDQPITLDVDLPSGWEAATALEIGEDGKYQAPSYLRFEDSPLLFSPGLTRVEFEVLGKPHAVTVVGQDEANTERIAEGCQRIVEATAELMQGLPYTHYEFLFGFVPEGMGSGLEHSFSTLILVSESASIEPDSRQFWGIVAHEFFHTWCAERIHVEGIHDPDLTQPFETGTIWVNEGITEYFTQHILVHAGLLEPEAMLANLTQGGLPAGMVGDQTWTDVSRAASKWESQRDLMTFAMRMYFLGPRVILALDLTMREASNGKRGVLDLVRFLNHAYVDADRGFGEDEMPAILSGVAQADLSEFYERYIDGSETPDVGPLLEVIGYELLDGELLEIDPLSERQLRAREDFFSIDG